jgi:dienelactone hydrolase
MVNLAMRYLVLLILFFHIYLGFGQKPPLDTSTFSNWPFVSGGIISNDGNYVGYYVYNLPAGSRKLQIRASHSEWESEFAGASQASFTNDNSRIIFKKGTDSIGVLILGQHRCDWITSVSDFALSGDKRDNWLAYRRTTTPEVLFLLSLNDGIERSFPSANWYYFSDGGRTLVLMKREKKDGHLKSVLEKITLVSGISTNIWVNYGDETSIDDYGISIAADQLAFIVNSNDHNRARNEIWYYRLGMDSAEKLLCEDSISIKDGLLFAKGPPEFSQDGKYIYLKFTQKEVGNQKLGSVHVDIWSYLDKVLQPFQLEKLNVENTYTAVLNLLDNKIIRLEQPGESVVGKTEGFVLVEDSPGYYSEFESYWNIYSQPSFWLVSIKDGSRKLIRDHIININEGIGLSPTGKWLLYYDNVRRDFFSYEISTGIRRNVTRKIYTTWTDSDNDMPDYKLVWVPWRGTWMENDKYVIIYDNFDIWMIDPKGIRFPVNLTNGYGRLHRIKFELAEDDQVIQQYSESKHSVLLLSAIDKNTMNRGFYTKTLGKMGDPELQVMGKFVFGEWTGHSSYNLPPVKAKEANVYLVKRMSASEAPNYFLTHDYFKHLSTITNIQPQLNYNWLTSDLIHWKDARSGVTRLAILYKPENFNFNRRYPIIFDFYEVRSDELSLFIRPKASQDRINIAWYVSHGYLVCVPDIHYLVGQPGLSAYNAVISTADYLSKMTWVDSRKMGIQGHSFGGYETNYIVTHSTLFAAACSASGISDLISWDGSVTRLGFPKFATERQQDRMGATLWQTPKRYIQNSPIFMADRVTTPLLLMNNKEDGIVPFTQGVEFFTALRELGKRVWMLQYDAGGHSLDRGKDAMDYSIRMAQFFDHYLKSEPPAKWMTSGVPARMKGIDDGLKLDSNIVTPGTGLNVKNH